MNTVERMFMLIVGRGKFLSFLDLGRFLTLSRNQANDKAQIVEEGCRIFPSCSGWYLKAEIGTLDLVHESIERDG
ncbi:hypothetical protein [Ktedonosporobacter rubrisoli]|uniref:hypothetical protein n=1 Tax=Ktedonosporobacter rubrisoli TaxID=2509675 RepID=UPI0013EE9E3C|nr:hypothetical protein [Ktedonosporobacter rubrisoli]